MPEAAGRPWADERGGLRFGEFGGRSALYSSRKNTACVFHVLLYFVFLGFVSLELFPLGCVATFILVKVASGKCWMSVGQN